VKYLHEWDWAGSERLLRWALELNPSHALADLTGSFCTSGSERESHEGGELDMSIRKYKPEQIVTVLRQIEVAMANGKTAPQACKEAEIHTQTYYRWRKEYGGMKVEQAKRLKELEKENGRLKRLVAELSLEKQVLKDVAEGNF
jgi:transposase-like protein